MSASRRRAVRFDNRRAKGVLHLNHLAPRRVDGLAPAAYRPAADLSGAAGHRRAHSGRPVSASQLRVVTRDRTAAIDANGRDHHARRVVRPPRPGRASFNRFYTRRSVLEGLLHSPSHSPSPVLFEPHRRQRGRRAGPRPGLDPGYLSASSAASAAVGWSLRVGGGRPAPATELTSQGRTIRRADLRSRGEIGAMLRRLAPTGRPPRRDAHRRATARGHRAAAGCGCAAPPAIWAGWQATACSRGREYGWTRVRGWWPGSWPGSLSGSMPDGALLSPSGRERRWAACSWCGTPTGGQAGLPWWRAPAGQLDPGW
jgi:hypothetical protein